MTDTEQKIHDIWNGIKEMREGMKDMEIYLAQVNERQQQQRKEIDESKTIINELQAYHHKTMGAKALIALIFSLIGGAVFSIISHFIKFKL